MLGKDIKPLDKFFIGRGEVRGFKFLQVYMTENAFLYEINNAGQLHYEVFKYKVNKRYGCISYPTAKAFGIWAWTYMTFEYAIGRLNQLSTCD